jgi:TrpR-related protein YerC/YecD
MKRRFTEDSWRKEPWFRGLVVAFRSLRSDDDTANFLRDIATLSELQALSERLETARLLAQGYSYRQVAKLTGASTTTVTRVAQFLENGEGGYRTVLKAHRHHRLVKSPATLADVCAPRGEGNVSLQPPSVGDSETASPPVPPRSSPLQKYLGRRPEGGQH